MTNRKKNPLYFIPVVISTLGLFLFFSASVFSQVVPVKGDSVAAIADTTNSIAKDSSRVKTHSPAKAALLSAILPGAGQVYNHKYWKLPIIYALGATAGSLIYYNYTIYSHLHNGYIVKIRDPSAPLQNFSVWTITGTLKIDLNQFEAGDLLSLEEGYRRDLDLSVIFAVAVYGLNIIDAVVDAHLFNFDVSDKLSLNIQPQFTPMGSFSHSGFGLNLNMQF